MALTKQGSCNANDLVGSVALRSWRMPSDANQAPDGELLPGSSLTMECIKGVDEGYAGRRDHI